MGTRKKIQVKVRVGSAKLRKYMAKVLDDAAHKYNLWGGGLAGDFFAKGNVWAFIDTDYPIDGAYSAGFCAWDSQHGRCFKEVSLEKFLELLNDGNNFVIED